MKQGIKTQMKHLKDAGLPETIILELGFIKYSSHLCPWVLMSPDTHVLGTNWPYSWKEQLVILDDREPARAQWPCLPDGEARIQHIPKRPTLIPAGLREEITKVEF
ncbi:hypothetical protein PHMEG_00013368 [Phytophthora megakarya]|uniref:Uncharacterized protein n=1 Tax=Phytophthora megakarya TaxID=4795 RepID=A0A225W912_9STRA|nr:hypothetical protein PHMEG_00013368 [Phytophthora megakarya]